MKDVLIMRRKKNEDSKRPSFPSPEKNKIKLIKKDILICLIKIRFLKLILLVYIIYTQP